VTAGTGGVIAPAEGTAPSVCAATAVDCIYADSTQHGLLANFNNVGYKPLVQGPTSWTTAHVVSSNGTNGGLVADSGVVAANLVVASSPGAGIAHFAGSTQTVTSSAVSLTADVSGVLPTANIAVALANQTSLRGNSMATAAGDATITQTIAHGAKALATGAISSAACTSAQTATATGALTTDVIDVSFNGDPTAVTGYVPLTAGMLTIIAYPTADTFNVKVCNNTSGSITPGAITLNWAVRR
jgi:hypothetical protein